ncbi:MAG TPA: hypothetical protein DCY20_03885 [Firmicutes bacterium]|nr:hypothetical protein [Bacillota bacterium]
MKRKNKWPKRIFLIVLTVIASFTTMLLAYVAGYEKDLMVYQESLAKLPEVNSVLEIAKYNGTEQYYVAKVKLINETEHYYFIKDNVVEYNVETKNILSTDVIVNNVMNQIQGDIKHYYLGIHEEKPIYEVVVSTQNQEVYVLVDAMSGELVATYELK